MSASRTLQRKLKADKDRRSELPKPIKPGTRNRHCGPDDGPMLRRFGLAVYLHFTKGYRQRRVPV